MDGKQNRKGQAGTWFAAYLLVALFWGAILTVSAFLIIDAIPFFYEPIDATKTERKLDIIEPSAALVATIAGLAVSLAGSIAAIRLAQVAINLSEQELQLSRRQSELEELSTFRAIELDSELLDWRVEHSKQALTLSENFYKHYSEGVRIANRLERIRTEVECYGWIEDISCTRNKETEDTLEERKPAAPKFSSLKQKTNTNKDDSKKYSTANFTELAKRINSERMKIDDGAQDHFDDFDDPYIELSDEEKMWAEIIECAPGLREDIIEARSKKKENSKKLILAAKELAKFALRHPKVADVVCESVERDRIVKIARHISFILPEDYWYETGFWDTYVEKTVRNWRETFLKGMEPDPVGISKALLLFILHGNVACDGPPPRYAEFSNEIKEPPESLIRAVLENGKRPMEVLPTSGLPYIRFYSNDEELRIYFASGLVEIALRLGSLEERRLALEKQMSRAKWIRENYRNTIREFVHAKFALIEIEFPGASDAFSRLASNKMLSLFQCERYVRVSHYHDHFRKVSDKFL